MSTLLTTPPPSGAASTPPSGSAPRRRWPWAVGAGLLVALVVVVAILLAGGGREPEPGGGSLPEVPDHEVLVRLLSELGAEIRLGTGPTATDDVALVLPGVELSEGQQRVVDAWVSDGGVVVGAVDGSLVDAGAVGLVRGQALERDPCDVEALADVDVVVVDTGDVAIEADSVVDPSADRSGCFHPAGTGVDGDASFVVVEELGAGSAVVLGGAGPFTDDLIAEADNAVLAAALLAPTPGTRLVVLVGEGAEGGSGGGGTGGGGDPGGGPGGGGGSGGGQGETPPFIQDDPETLVDAIPLGVRLALAQAVIALVLLVAWRARRLGRPRTEPVPVPIEGSELVEAVGSLLRRTGDAGAAAAVLREDLRRQLARRLGLPETTAADQLAALAAARTGTSEARLREVVEDRPVTSAEGLVALSRSIDDVRQEVLRDVPA